MDGDGASQRTPPPPPSAAEIAELRARRRAKEAARIAEEERCELADAMVRELAEIEQRLDERAAEAEAAREQAAATIGRVCIRRKPRFQIEASVLVDHQGTLVTLPLVNISLTGALIANEGLAISMPRVGTLLFITLFATGNPTRQVDVNARVVRKDVRGMALTWSADQSATHSVAVLLDELSG